MHIAQLLFTAHVFVPSLVLQAWCFVMIVPCSFQRRRYKPMSLPVCVFSTSELLRPTWRTLFAALLAAFAAYQHTCNFSMSDLHVLSSGSLWHLCFGGSAWFRTMCFFQTRSTQSAVCQWHLCFSDSVDAKSLTPDKHNTHSCDVLYIGTRHYSACLS